MLGSVEHVSTVVIVRILYNVMCLLGCFFTSKCQENLNGFTILKPMYRAVSYIFYQYTGGTDTVCIKGLLAIMYCLRNLTIYGGLLRNLWNARRAIIIMDVYIRKKLLRIENAKVDIGINLCLQKFEPSTLHIRTIRNLMESSIMRNYCSFLVLLFWLLYHTNSEFTYSHDCATAERTQGSILLPAHKEMISEEILNEDLLEPRNAKPATCLLSEVNFVKYP